MCKCHNPHHSVHAVFPSQNYCLAQQTHAALSCRMGLLCFCVCVCVRNQSLSLRLINHTCRRQVLSSSCMYTHVVFCRQSHHRFSEATHWCVNYLLVAHTRSVGGYAIMCVFECACVCVCVCVCVWCMCSFLSVEFEQYKVFSYFPLALTHLFVFVQLFHHCQ